MSFSFKGALEASKSWMNRALILQSYNPQLKIVGSSSAQDVLLLRDALVGFAQGQTDFYTGLGGTTFRFLALRVSRKAGQYFIKAEPSLLQRPQAELVQLLKQFDVQAELTSKGLKIHSQGWKKPRQPVLVGTEQSSQFLSALALNSVDLDFDFYIEKSFEKITSQPYFQMTENLLRTCRVQWGRAHQKIQIAELQAEVDISSAFALIAAAIIGGDVTITNWPEQTLQPDIQFVNFFNSMKIQFRKEGSLLQIQKQNQWLALRADVGFCPDVVPVLGILCAFAEGKSVLRGAPQLKHKESNRIEKMQELLSRCGFQVISHDDGLEIEGCSNLIYKKRDLILFDPAHDHRMAFAAALLALKGFPVRLTTPDVINKSYPQFYQHIGLVK